MELVLSFFIVFVVVYLFYFLFVIFKKKKISNIKNSTEALFLQKRYKINYDKINIKVLANLVALTNSFIIATTFVIIEFIDNIILKLMVAFVVLIILILGMYSLLGKYLKKKEGK